jgi:hypothetical protein
MIFFYVLNIYFFLTRDHVTLLYQGAKLRTQFVLSGAISLFSFVIVEHLISTSISHEMAQTISSSLQDFFSKD